MVARAGIKPGRKLAEDSGRTRSRGLTERVWSADNAAALRTHPETGSDDGMGKAMSSTGLMIGGAASALVLLSSLGGIAASVLNTPRLYFLLGFETVILIAAVFGVLIGRRKFGAGPGLGLLCVAGVVLAGSLLGYISCRDPLRGVLFGVPLKWLILGRFALGGLIGIGAAAVVLGRRPKESMSSLVRGLAFGAAFFAFLAAIWYLRSHAAQLGQLIQTLGLLLSGAIGLGLLAAAMHYTIRAFEFGRLDDGSGDNAGRSAST